MKSLFIYFVLSVSIDQMGINNWAWAFQDYGEVLC